MKKLSQKRILHLLKRHCIAAEAVFSHSVKDDFGDTIGKEVYARHEIYFSNLLHRYNPYIKSKLKDESLAKMRLTPMAILPSDDGRIVAEGDIVEINDGEYRVIFCENIRNCYYLLSLSMKK